jgi:hypothetical protein
MKTSNSEPLLETGQSNNIDMLSKGKVKKRIQVSSLRKAPPGVSYSITERPPNRSEISKLENDLEERISAVLYSETTDLHNLETGNMYQPDRDAIMFCRDKIIKSLQITTDELLKEEWTDKLIRCECLKETCDDVSKQLCDMLSVSSAELGNVLRKLRYTYIQSFEQMRISWEYLRTEYLTNKGELHEIGVVPTPWTAFSIATSNENDRQNKGDEIKTKFYPALEECVRIFIDEAKDKFVATNRENSIERISNGCLEKANVILALFFNLLFS